MSGGAPCAQIVLTATKSGRKFMKNIIIIISHTTLNTALLRNIIIFLLWFEQLT